MSAGCLFTNGSHVLGGYQKGAIGGIGGKAKEGENSHNTALREMLEEIFEVYDFPIENVWLPPKKIIVRRSYTIFVYGFDDLESISAILKGYGVISPLYTEIPLSIWDIVLKRLTKDGTEISALCILPVVKHESGPFVEPYFVGDIQKLIQRP
jgi:hypothetical protein